MPDEELRAWSPDALVALIRRLEAQLAAATVRIAELEAELARRGGPPKTPQNSSTPPSKGFKRERRAVRQGPVPTHRERPHTRRRTRRPVRW